MQYRTNVKNGDMLSQLGLGCMRFPRSGRKVDQSAADAIIARSIELGVNYFDTAYIYPGSEEALGSALKTLGKRAEVKVATKLPPFMCKSAADFDRIFNKQLARLQTDYIDYYLMHMLGAPSDWKRLCALGAEDWLAGKLRSGRIRNVGFSFHGGRRAFLELVDAFDWGFCMVQYNYFDENNQASKEGVRYASQKGMPVFIMEPLRGGLLVNGMPKAAVDAFARVNKERSPAEWGLAWLYDQPEPTLVLSGMGSLEMLEQNAAAADTFAAGCLSDDERAAYAAAVLALNATVKVPCTGCNYCMPCPHGVDIPTCFAAYNATYAAGLVRGMRQYFQTTGGIQKKQSRASLCKRCGKCEAHCPQAIPIMNSLKDVSRRVEGFWYRPATALARAVMLGKQ